MSDTTPASEFDRDNLESLATAVCTSLYGAGLASAVLILLMGAGLDIPWLWALSPLWGVAALWVVGPTVVGLLTD